jgi:hypothetical protein
MSRHVGVTQAKRKTGKKDLRKKNEALTWTNAVSSVTALVFNKHAPCHAPPAWWPALRLACCNYQSFPYGHTCDQPVVLTRTR